MEALVSTGRHLEVKKFYNDTLELYFRAQGLCPSKKLHDLMNLFSAQMEHSYAVLDDIQRQLTMGERDRSGGYLCSYPVFQGIYQMVQMCIRDRFTRMPPRSLRLLQRPRLPYRFYLSF